MPSARAVELEQLVTARQAARQRSARAVANRSITEAIIVLVVLTALTILIGTILGRLVVGREMARRRSERTTHILQQSLLPSALPSIPGCEVAVRFAPAEAGELVGGDFYDVFGVGPESWAIVVGDVCGKGAEAAQVTAMARWTLRSLSAEPAAPDEVLRSLNDAMLRDKLHDRFITIAYVLLSLKDGHTRAAVSCAGHPAPIVVPAAGEPTTLAVQGDLLGMWQDVILRTTELQLQPGDSIVVYTDGVTDQGPEFKSESADVMLAERRPGASAEQLASLLERYGEQRSGRRRDDIAIIALRFAGRGAERPGPGIPSAERGAPSVHLIVTDRRGARGSVA